MGAGLLGLGVTWLLSRRLAGRVAALIAYTRRIGTGELVPASWVEALEIVPDSAGPGTVTDRTFLGSAVRLEATLDTGEKVLVESSSLSAHVKLGDRIAMRILAESVVVAEPNEPSPA